MPVDVTIARNALPTSRSGGPPVPAVRCPQGHLNPPEAVRCRQCGIEVPSQAATTEPRPALGVLRLRSTWAGAPEQIVLDRAAILGRRPQVDHVTGAVPRLVELPSPEQDISRNHCRVTLEGWHVLVADLQSVNGTVIQLPGEEPQRLRPEEPTLIVPGTIITLADVVAYVYEVVS